MTPEERDRLVKVESRLDGLNDWMHSIDSKLEQLNNAAQMGKGAWWLILRLGAVLAAVAAAGAWIFDKVRHHP